ncbi:uncharacterized protein ATNIH1004_006598 [Aspergillus tanneri]|uniref:Protein kinase domain-containing protein n=1 Tax=Aspergillus tanneri TaxID=1220188 RepID=A0A5M9MPS9_9EURO|nr:uncharacterized protein ATNIH1004_006598 [Aspergillus tanneri]KAA8647896.1 hypothetical protein ATNIH1004_006598 [Aspergillus tanneri]
MSTANNTKRSTTLPTSRKDLHALQSLKRIDENEDTSSLSHLHDRADNIQSNSDQRHPLNTGHGSFQAAELHSKYPHLNVNKSHSAESIPANRGRFPVKVGSCDSARVDGHTWPKYQPFWESDQAGLSIIAHDNSIDHKIVAIKKAKQQANKKQRSQLHSVKHDNIVQLLDVFSTDSSLYLVYESLEISLHNVQAACRGELNEVEMSIVGKEVLGGLNYIHNELGLAHEHVDSKNILLSYNTCRIKLGALLVDLKEPGTSGRNPGTLQLARPQDVSDLCNEFIQQSATLSAEALLKELAA